MPWCDDCSRYLTPTSLGPDATCPICGEVIGDPREQRAPWHFKLLLVGVVGYLGWRAVQGVVWVVQHL